MGVKTTEYGNSTTRKLKDGAVTMEKLAENVREYLDIAVLPVEGVAPPNSGDAVFMCANRCYEISVRDSMTIMLTPPVDTSVTNEYQGCFDTGDVAPNVTWPSDIVWSEEPTVDADTHYEFSIRYADGKYYGLLYGWPIESVSSASIESEVED